MFLQNADAATVLQTRCKNNLRELWPRITKTKIHPI